jgi:hypothetical protein
VSGGFAFGGIVTGTFRTATGWTASGFNDLPTASDLTAFAYCSPNVTSAAGTGAGKGDPELLAAGRLFLETS